MKVEEIKDKLLPYFKDGQSKVYNTILDCAEENELSVLGSVFGVTTYLDSFKTRMIPILRITGDGYSMYITKTTPGRMFLKYGTMEGLWIAASKVNSVEDIITILEMNGLAKDIK